jgi:excisionase family DNA binding protein
MGPHPRPSGVFVFGPRALTEEEKGKRVSEAAETLGISATTIRRLEREGQIPALPRDRAGHRRLEPADIDAIRRALYPSRDRASRAEQISGERPAREAAR